MGNLQWAVDLADELIVENGKPAVFYREVAQESQDPDKPWRPDGIAPEPPTDFEVIIVVDPYSERHIDGTVVRRGDVRCYLAAKGLTYVPRPGDYSEFGGQKFKVVNVITLEPGVDRVLYEMQMRG